MKKLILIAYLVISGISFCCAQKLEQNIKITFINNLNQYNKLHPNDNVSAYCIAVISKSPSDFNNPVSLWDYEIVMENLNQSDRALDVFIKGLYKQLKSMYGFKMTHDFFVLDLGLSYQDAMKLINFCDPNRKNKEAARKKKEKADTKEKLYTILEASYFFDGLAMVAIDIKHEAMNYKKLPWGYFNMKGYINMKGDYVINPKYEVASDFVDGFAVVNTNKGYVENYEYINKNGQNVFNQKYSDARNFSEGLAAIHPRNNNWGFINKEGKIVIKTQYEEVGDFKEGIARVKFQDKWGYIDKEGNEIISPQFSNAHDFFEGLAVVSKSVNYHYTVPSTKKYSPPVIRSGKYTEYGFIDKTGKYAFPPGKAKNIAYKTKYDEIKYDDFNEGYALISGAFKNSLRVTADGLDYYGVGFISKEGKVKVKSVYIFKDLDRLSEGLALAQRHTPYATRHKYGYVNEKLQWIISPIFDEAGRFVEGMARVQINDNWGFINKEGKVIINPEILQSKTELTTKAPFQNVSDFSEGLAVVKTKEKYGYINKQGEWVIKPTFKSATPFYNGIAIVKMEDRKGLSYIDKTGKVLFVKFL